MISHIYRKSNISESQPPLGMTGILTGSRGAKMANAGLGCPKSKRLSLASIASISLDSGMPKRLGLWIRLTRREVRPQKATRTHQKQSRLNLRRDCLTETIKPKNPGAPVPPLLWI